MKLTYLHKILLGIIIDKPLANTRESTTKGES